MFVVGFSKDSVSCKAKLRPTYKPLFMSCILNSAVVKLKKTRKYAIFDKSIKLLGVLAYDTKFIFRGEGIEFSNLGGACGPFYALKFGIIARPSNFEKPYLHFQWSDFCKFNIKLLKKTDLLNEKKYFIIETRFGG